MALPIGFLLGLLVVVGHCEFETALPGEGTVEGLLLACAALAAPLLLAQLAHVVTLRALVTARPVKVPPRALLALSALATPLALHVLFAHGAYGDWVERFAPASHLARALLAVLPLYLVELPRLLFVGRVDALLEADLANAARPSFSMLPSWAEVWPATRLRFGWPLLALLPIALLGGALDVLQLDRSAYVIVFGTSFGFSWAAISFLFLFALLLPFWFRWAFGAARDLPEPQGEALRATAQALGFPPRRLLWLPTGMRAVNAMMVGPLPVGRLLCVTDGLLAMLDLRSLSGVLAHEVGHARMGHPGVLMLIAVMLPLLLLVPARMFDLEELDVVLQAAIILSVVLSVWLTIRALARRFEHEADVASVQLLGAEPCSRALAKVAALTMPPARRLHGRLVSLHPDERDRLEVMQRYEREPAFRAAFDARSRSLRRWVLVGVTIALGLASWAWWTDWRYERLIVRFHTGDFVGALAVVEELGADGVPPRWRDTYERLHAQTACALELAPGCRDWQSAQRQLVPAAWQRGERALLVDGPAAAYPWFALATMALDAPSPAERAIERYCEAAADGEPEVVERLVAIIRRLGPPPALAQVFEAPR